MHKDHINAFFKEKNRIVVFLNDNRKAIGIISRMENYWFAVDSPDTHNFTKIYLIPYEIVSCIIPVEEFLKAGGQL